MSVVHWPISTMWLCATGSWVCKLGFEKLPMRLLWSENNIGVLPAKSLWKYLLSCKKSVQRFSILNTAVFSILNLYTLCLQDSRSTNHIFATFWPDPICMLKQANMTEKASVRVNFHRVSHVYLSFINRSPWKLVKMCILISLTNHIAPTFWYDPIYMQKQANIKNRPLWQPFLSYNCQFWHENGVGSKNGIKAKWFIY